MSRSIKGLTVEIQGSTTGLDKALKDVNGTIKTTQSQLKDVQKLLKLITLNRKPEFHRVSVAELFSRVLENTSDMLAARGILLKTESSVQSLNLDADLMQSVLINLVDNAGKASGAGQTILLSADEKGFSVHGHALIEAQRAPVSSSRIRALLEEGCLHEAHELLGRHHMMRASAFFSRASFGRARTAS